MTANQELLLLHKECRKCKSCELSQTRNNVVVAKGNSKAKILIIGEGPGEQEAAKAITKTKKSTESESPKKKIWTTSEIANLKPHQFEKFEEDIDLARLEGRIEQR